MKKITQLAATLLIITVMLSGCATTSQDAQNTFSNSFKNNMSQSAQSISFFNQ